MPKKTRKQKKSADKNRKPVRSSKRRSSSSSHSSHTHETQNNVFTFQSSSTKKPDQTASPSDTKILSEIKKDLLKTVILAIIGIIVIITISQILPT